VLFWRLSNRISRSLIFWLNQRLLRPDINPFIKPIIKPLKIIPKRTHIKSIMAQLCVFALLAGRPHFGQAGALSDTEVPHSIQFTSAMLKILSGRDVRDIPLIHIQRRGFHDRPKYLQEGKNPVRLDLHP
jgi:hypothetical protein